MTSLTRVLSLAVLVAVVGVAGIAGAEDPSETCGMCHEDVVAWYQKTAHALDRRDAPTCETCHGDGTQHMDEGGDASLIRVPSGLQAERVCLDCHGDDLHSGFNAGRVHGRNDVSCTSCHVIHPESMEAAATMRTKPDGELCASCHARQERSFNRPFGHTLGRSGLECISCHDPHGGAGQQSLKLDRTGDPVCVTCHSGQRGPFVFPHVTGATGDCLSCHEPHGSSNPNALKRSRVDQLCLECHSPIGGGTLGSQAVSSHDLLSPRYRNCTTCHVAIHGSNTSPTLRK